MEKSSNNNSANINLPASNLQGLSEQLLNLSTVFKSQAAAQVNKLLTLRNWIIGYYIATYELDGEDRAKYGDKVYEELAKRLKYHRGFNIRNLRNCRDLYLTYPQIVQSVIAELQHFEFINKNSLITLQSILKEKQVQGKTINAIVEKAENDFDKNSFLSTEKILSRLSYTHLIELIKLDPPLKRHFYEIESIKNNWSVRDLKRAINSMLYERTGLSSDKQAFLDKQSESQKLIPEDVIKNAYVLEFLGIEEESKISENDLEFAIINNLQNFLVELGRGFCFEARQKRITFDNNHYKVDLVFYHRVLKCHILVDLKIGEFDHADAGQMNLYLNYFKHEEMEEGDNPPIGIVLCANKNDTLVKYATGGMSEQIFVSKYLVSLPKEEELRNIIEKEMERRA